MATQRWRLAIPLFVLLLPCVAAASSIRINGSCVVGTCLVAEADALHLGESTGQVSGSSPLTVNLDQFQIAWTYAAYFNEGGTHLTVTPTVTYVGLLPSVGDDLITFEYFQNFYDARPGFWNGNYKENVPLVLSADAGALSTISAELSYGGQGLGLVGPYGPGTNVEEHNLSLSGVTNPLLSAVFTLTVHFKPGASPNSFGTSTTTSAPEPSQALPAGIALLAGIWQFTIRGRKKTIG